MDVITGLTAISQTIAITKDLRNSDDKIVVAEFKLRIADMVDKLLDAKQSLVDAQEREATLRKEIADLKRDAEKRSKLRDVDGCLYEVDESGSNVGQPYCNLCFVREDKFYRLKFVPRYPGSNGTFYAAPDPEHYFCLNCKERAGG